MKDEGCLCRDCLNGVLSLSAFNNNYNFVCYIIHFIHAILY